MKAKEKPKYEGKYTDFKSVEEMVLFSMITGLKIIRDGKAFRRFNSTDDQHFFLLFAKNGRIILNSEMYTQKAGMENGIDAVTKYSKDINNFIIYVSDDKRFY